VGRAYLGLSAFMPGTRQLPKVCAPVRGGRGGGSRLLQVSSGPEIASRDCPLQAGSGHWPPPVQRTIQRRPSCPWTLPRPAPSGSSLSGMSRTKLQEDSEVAESRSWSCRVASAAEWGAGVQEGEGAPMMHRGAHGVEPRFAHGPWASWGLD
jgi:hypothetical protein